MRIAFHVWRVVYVPKWDKFRETLMSGQADNNIDFRDMRRYLLHLGFVERIRGAHHIFERDDIEEIINLQPDGSQCKGYQIRQARKVLLANGL